MWGIQRISVPYCTTFHSSCRAVTLPQKKTHKPYLPISPIPIFLRISYPVQSSLDNGLTTQIQCRRSLIQQEHARVPHERTCDGDPLFLSSAQLCSLLTDHRVKLERQVLDEFVGVRLPGRLRSESVQGMLKLELTVEEGRHEST